jgi:hypothetical protein
MPRENGEGLRSRYVLAFRAMGLTLNGIFLAAAAAQAGVLDASWTAPTTNADGSALTGLAHYRVYYSTSASPCPGGVFVEVTTATSSPQPNQTVSFQLKGLSTASTYSVSVTAVDKGGNESACSAVASAVARGESAVAPTGTVSFGNVMIGSSAIRTFTVRSISSGTIAGSAFVPPPFSIDSGSPFTLVGTGATAIVIVRFTPTSTVAASSSVSFIANGDTQSRLVTGTGMTVSATPPTPSLGTSPPRRPPPAVGGPTPALAATTSDSDRMGQGRGSTGVDHPTFEPDVPDSETKAQRRQLRRPPRTPVAAGSSTDADDPRAVIDWLLMRQR